MGHPRWPRTFLAWTACALLAAQAPPPLPTVQAAAERFDAAQAKVVTFQAPFTLTIRRVLLKTPTVTKGTLYLQGSEFVHFTFAPPEDLVIHVTPKALVSYSPAAGSGEMLKIDPRAYLAEAVAVAETGLAGGAVFPEADLGVSAFAFGATRSHCMTIQPALVSQRTSFNSIGSRLVALE